mmetsp:Transcript_90284/g.150953  ORF Transcript_90284/g.150953 Transcript_90284/m.150953 type:complete len:127 (+) Transcript_90284:1056-1436(+)
MVRYGNSALYTGSTLQLLFMNVSMAWCIGGQLLCSFWKQDLMMSSGCICQPPAGDVQLRFSSHCMAAGPNCKSSILVDSTCFVLFISFLQRVLQPQSPNQIKSASNPKRCLVFFPKMSGYSVNAAL